jgi:hypothetical protein
LFAVCNVFEGDEHSVQEAIDWLMVFQEPARLLENWQKTAKTRLNYIHSTSPADKQKVTLVEILSKWPRYKDKNCHLLVNFL